MLPGLRVKATLCRVQHMGTNGNNKPSRYRTFNIVAYESDTFQSFFENVKKLDFACIYHDKDVYTNEDFEKEKISQSQVGQLKKPHYHYVIHFKNARSISSVAKLLLIPPHYVAWSNDLNRDLRYLIHADDSDKFQYNKDLVFCSDYMQRLFNKAIDGRFDDEIFLTMLQMLNDEQYNVSVSTMSAKFAFAGYFYEFRRNFAMWNVLIKEHNGAVSYE